MNGASSRFARFLVIGGASTALQYAVLILLVRLSAAPVAAASSIGFGIGACVNYLGNHAFTFRSDSPHRFAAPRFAATALAGLLQTYLLMWLLAQYLHVNYLFAQVLTTGVVLAFNFVALSRWAYVSPQHCQE